MHYVLAVHWHVLARRLNHEIIKKSTPAVMTSPVKDSWNKSKEDGISSRLELCLRHAYCLQSESKKDIGLDGKLFSVADLDCEYLGISSRPSSMRYMNV